MRVVNPHQISLLSTTIDPSSEQEWLGIITSTSTSSHTIGTGAKTFATAIGLGYTATRGIIITRTSAPTTTYMVGTVTSYNVETGALVVNIASVEGTGTHTDWTITTNDHTYDLDELVKVSTTFPVKIYKSLRSNNINKFPPDNLEASVETASSTSSVTVQTRAIVSSNSTTSLAVGTGAKSLTTNTGKDYTAGRTITIARTSAPTTTNMSGTVTSYIAGTGALVVDITLINGSGTFTDWDITTTDTTALRNFTTQTGKNFVPGMMVLVSHSVTPNSYNMTGEVMSYSSSTGALEVNTFSTTGTGTLNSWTIVSQDEIGFWEEVGATNSHAMFDTYVNTKSVKEGGFSISVDVDKADTLVLFELEGTTVNMALWDSTKIGVLWEAPTISRQFVPQIGSAFGAALEISPDGNTLLVGAPYYDPSYSIKLMDGSESITDGDQFVFDGENAAAVDGGVIHIFDYEGTRWVEREILFPSLPVRYTHFATSISLAPSQQVMVVGAVGDDPVYSLVVDGAEQIFDGSVEIVDTASLAHSSAGQIHLFDLISAQWVERMVISPNSLRRGDRFGAAVVARNSSQILVGAPGDSTIADSAGAVYVINIQGMIWSNDLVITEVGLLADDAFGSALAVSDDGKVLAVGSPGHTSSTGIVYVYDLILGVWTLRDTVGGADSVVGDLFGSSVELNSDGAILFVGAPGVTTSEGALHTFDWVTNAWVERLVIFPTTLQAEDSFSKALAVTPSSSMLVVGSPGSDNFGTNAGMIFSYLKPQPLWSSLQSLIYDMSVVGGITDWYEYFFGEITPRTEIVEVMPVPYTGTLLIDFLADVGEPAACGNIIHGRSYYLGSTQYGANIGIKDYSLKETDDEGKTTIRQGYWAKKNDITLYLENSMVDSVYRRLAGLRGTPTVWMANSDKTSYQSLVVYGFYSDFSITVEGPSHSWCELQIEGLI